MTSLTSVTVRTEPTSPPASADQPAVAANGNRVVGEVSSSPGPVLAWLGHGWTANEKTADTRPLKRGLDGCVTTPAGSRTCDAIGPRIPRWELLTRDAPSSL